MKMLLRFSGQSEDKSYAAHQLPNGRFEARSVLNRCAEHQRPMILESLNIGILRAIVGLHRGKVKVPD